MLDPGTVWFASSVFNIKQSCFMDTYCQKGKLIKHLFAPIFPGKIDPILLLL